MFDEGEAGHDGLNHVCKNWDYGKARGAVLYFRIVDCWFWLAPNCAGASSHVQWDENGRRHVSRPHSTPARKPPRCASQAIADVLASVSARLMDSSAMPCCRSGIKFLSRVPWSSISHSATVPSKPNSTPDAPIAGMPPGPESAAYSPPAPREESPAMSQKA